MITFLNKQKKTKVNQNMYIIILELQCELSILYFMIIDNSYAHLFSQVDE